MNPKLDLVLERVVDVPVSLVWAAWTQPEHLVHWFTPSPWTTVDAEIDLRPGGIFRTVMQSPEGEKFDNAGCYLEVVENERLVWTDALLPGYRPAPSPFFTGILDLEDLGDKTRYTATAMHQSEETRNQHAEMGFMDGWGSALDQLVAYVKGLPASQI